MTTSAPARLPATASVLVSGDDVFEDLFGASAALLGILSRLGYPVTARMGLGSFVELEAAGRLPSVLVLFTAMGECSPRQQEALERAVEAGMGVVALHTAVVFGMAGDGSLSPGYRRLFELLGSRYASHGPLPHESRFTVRLEPEHPVTAGIEAFEIGHEHYRLELASPPPTVLAWRDSEDGPEPILHVSERGRGRVVYLQLGHDLRVWDEPSVQTLLARALEWATRREANE